MLALMPATEHAAVETFYARTVGAAGLPSCTFLSSLSCLTQVIQKYLHASDLAQSEPISLPSPLQATPAW